MESRLFLAFVVLGGTLVFVPGCSSNEATYREFTEADVQAAPEDDHHHPAHGPHDGELVELGGGKYHAEVVHDATSGTVTVYILDGEAQATVPIAAPHVTINLKHGDAPEQFKLAASPIEGDAEGKSSRFVSNDAHLGEDLDSEGVQARIVVEIDGQSYSGDLQHSHGHADHKH